MATGGKLIEELSEQLSCAVCLEKYVEPKVLACLHSFCKRCLGPLVVKGVLPCPSCREETDTSKKGVEGLRDNFFINGLLDMMALHADGKTSTLMCSICDEEEDGSQAVSLCQECAHYMCDLHNRSHNKGRTTKYHKVCLLDDLKSGALKGSLLIRQKMCPYHDKEELKMFCETCDETICRDCTMVTHRNHDYNFVKDATDKHSSIIRDSMTEAESLVSQVKERINSIDVRLELLRKVYQSTNQEIVKAFQEFSSHVEAKMNELLHKAEGHANAEEKRLQDREEKLTFSLRNLQNSIKFTKQALDSQNDIELLGMKKQILSRLQDLKTEMTKEKRVEKKQVNLKFSANDDSSLKQALQQYGEIKFNSDFPEDCSVTVTVTRKHGRQVTTYTVNLEITAGDDKGMYCSDGTILSLNALQNSNTDVKLQQDKTDQGNLFQINAQTVYSPETIYHLKLTTGLYYPRGSFQWGDPLFLVIGDHVREVEYQSKLQ